MAAPQPKIIDLMNKDHEATELRVSFEYFPPRTDKAEEQLKAALPHFARQKPVFMDVTWGAGGTTHDKTPALCKYIMDTTNVVVNMHLTCTNMEEEKIHQALDYCRANGIRNLVALRGDPPAGQEWHTTNTGFSCALDLVKHIRAVHGDYFCIAVAGYPEGHPTRIDTTTGIIPEAEMVAEIEYLKQKVDAGADYIITQLFYDNQHFFNFKSKCEAAGIRAPIVPGMLAPLSFAGLQRMISLCKTYVPAPIMQRFTELQGDDAAFKAYGIHMVTDMVKELRTNGVFHFHFYTLNVEHATFEILKALGRYVE